ncbi:hypothetical protein DXG01_006314 [Tephrocybe rancida]|nr:hypothetical protein DXG01_006314 [Tephrocybe rancida]
MSHARANGSASKERPSPPPLPPLQYLQNQRRGSTTDPSSLHITSSIKLNTGFRPPGEQPSSASSGASSNHLLDARPPSPYVFGDATPHTGGGEMQIRNLLRSSPGPKDKEMEVDAGFDYSMRRHSIAVGQDKGQGTKRKMGEELLAGPGIPSGEGPAPKRRGSAIDTARIAQLSLNDRRNSVDSRATTDSRANWWLGDRRDSTSSVLSYSSAFTGADSPQSRVPSGISTFTWPEEMQSEPNRSESRPPLPPNEDDPNNAPSPTGSARHKDSGTPYSRSPELRVSHKLAERKRRKEMKELFDELRDQLPADRGMKASKWEILTKAIDFVVQLKQSHQEMAREVEMLRHELDATRQGLPFAPVYGQPPIPGQFPPGTLQHPHPHPHPPPPPPPHVPSQSRPPSAQNVLSPEWSRLQHENELYCIAMYNITDGLVFPLSHTGINSVFNALSYQVGKNDDSFNALLMLVLISTNLPTMAPKAHSMALLFHPKKGANKKDPKKDSESPAPSPSPRKPGPPRPKPQPAEPEEEGLNLPSGPFQEFKLMSSALNGWKYDVMKFDSRKSVDLARWTPPIKLNRKELRRDTEPGDAVPQAVGPMLGPDGKPVIGVDGKMVMVDAEGRPIHASDGASGSGANGKGKAPAANGKKRFQKKTRQVYVVPEEVRQLRREERYPWVMEDSSPDKEEMWTAQMEDVARSDTHALFMPAVNDIFKFVPTHRWYKFQKKMKHDLPTDTLNVESLVFSQRQKKGDTQAWLAARTAGKGVSSATAAMFKAEAEGRSIGGGLVHSSEQSLGPGGRKLKTVDSGMNGLFDDDEDGDSKKRREKEMGGEGDMDEQVYEEDFADDEEQMEVDADDEEAKELEERMKREYKAANKQREAGVDESDDEEPLPGMTKQAKAIQKLIRNLRHVEEEEEEPVVSTEPAIQPQPQQVDSRSSSQPPKPGASVPARPSDSNSRAASPVGSPSLGGHSVVAKRATSPKPPKLKPTNVNGGASPLGSRATSPAASNSRAASPVAGVNGSRTDTAPKPSNKRKAVDDPVHGAPAPNGVNGIPKPKKRKAQAVGVTTVNVNVPAEQLKAMLIEWLRSRPDPTTRDCISHFTNYLTDSEKKGQFSALVRDVAQLKDGVLVLRKKYQEGGSSAPSPAAVG